MRFFDDGRIEFKQCTLGFHAILGGDLGFVTNSHCSTSQGAVDDTLYHQPNNFLSEDIIGIEIVDPGFRDCFCAPQIGCLATCRQSDSNFSLSLDHDADLGFIARPALDAEEWDGVSKFRIIDKMSLSFSGKRVTKVGQKTGRTAGTVRFTGMRIHTGGLRFLENQVLADYEHVQGDSGGPVIIEARPPFNPNSAFLAGIHNGGIPTPLGFLGVFSPIQGVEADLGTLNVEAP